MHPECPPPTPPASPTVSVFNLASLAVNVPRTCPSTCNCPKICELTTDTDAPVVPVDTNNPPPATTDDEVVSQGLNPEAQDFTPKASASGPHEPISSLMLPASIENKASCSRHPRDCCKTSKAAPCNAAKLEKLHLNKKAAQAASITCCDLRTPAACETVASCVKDTPCHGRLKDVEDVTGPTYTSPESGSV
ncbi:hypothetical protein Q9L58_005289 [Maublancomyces gigas]|uniref:Uncharacterized protein n=1 Tax=Discina gigas TaxID=1032678 RepID=A0ABR3GJP8_9PEZI